MYNPQPQYRCEIIRAKSISEMDDLLPAYAKVVDEICPCPTSEFEEKFNTAFARFLPEADRKKKTFDNHRTENCGKLFGMYYASDDGYVYISDRARKYLADNDQPAFFKDMCYKFQFPNGMQKTSLTVMTRISDKICIRPLAFVLRVLQLARDAQIDITKKVLGYYVLNARDVLQGKASPPEVLEVISRDVRNQVTNEIKNYNEDGTPKAYSYNYQHIVEQCDYLMFANLVRLIDNDRIVLNPHEEEAINLFSSTWDSPLEFNVYNYDLSTVEKRKRFQLAWDMYYGQLSPVVNSFTTQVDALNFTGKESIEPQPEQRRNVQRTARECTNPVAFGDEGENVVFNYERERVGRFNKHLVKKVLSLGKTKGLGYDIQSVIAEPGPDSDFVKYIEVKSTKRVTCPDCNDTMWIDTLNFTRNEWVAAKQHTDFYFIYRVYFTQVGVSIFILSNISKQFEDGRMQVTPMTYRVDFGSRSISKAISI